VRLELSGEVDGELAALAGRNADNTRAAVLVSHFKGSDRSLNLDLSDLPWKGDTAFEMWVVDREHAFSRVGQGSFKSGTRSLPLALQAPGVALIKMQPQNLSDPKSN
jgi:hypothetical protein